MKTLYYSFGTYKKCAIYFPLYEIFYLLKLFYSFAYRTILVSNSKVVYEIVSGFCLTLKHRYFILIHRDTSKSKNDWLFLPFGEKYFIFQKYFQLSLPNNLSAHAIKMIITWGLLIWKYLQFKVIQMDTPKPKHLHHFFFCGTFISYFLKLFLNFNCWKMWVWILQRLRLNTGSCVWLTLRYCYFTFI